MYYLLFVCNIIGNLHADVLLICDGCDLCYHIYCVGLDNVPHGDWYCEGCGGESRLNSESRNNRQRRQRRSAANLSFVVSDDDDDGDYNPFDTQSLSGNDDDFTIIESDSDDDLEILNERSRIRKKKKRSYNNNNNNNNDSSYHSENEIEINEDSFFGNNNNISLSWKKSIKYGYIWYYIQYYLIRIYIDIFY